MKPALQLLQETCPGVDEGLLRAHLRRLSEDYFDRFEIDQVAAHINALASLDTARPVEILVAHGRDGIVELTILAFDYPAEFSLLTGILFGMGVDIISGDVFTYAHEASPVARVRRTLFRRRQTSVSQRRAIIDHFWCSVAESITSFTSWGNQVRSRLTEVVRLLEKGDAESINEAKHRVNEQVTRRLVEIQASDHPVLYPVNIEIDNDRETMTRLRVSSQDTPAFLYTMSAAISLHDVSIESVRIRTAQGQVEDEIDIVTKDGECVVDPEILDQIRLSILFTKQFTYFLDRAPDPYTALSRFEFIVKDLMRLPERGSWFELLGNPRTMQDLARILGTSDYLWEDFIRLQYEALAPILESHVGERAGKKDAESFTAALHEILSECDDFEAKRKKFNEFKNREIFLIDLDHILAGGNDFRRLARELTELAECVVRVGAEVVYEELVARHGHPRTVAGLDVPHAILGLGKFGGAALGYASDIELMVVYSDSGDTDGATPLANSEFFGNFVAELAKFIVAKREGIFDVDLRLRPHGSAGPLASSLGAFCEYYGVSGEAHSAERLALVRMRAVGGDKTLGKRLERVRDEFLYHAATLDLSELRELRLRQFKEREKPGRYNAKFSPGALVDLEYTVQILQAREGAERPKLRTPKIHKALEGLREAGMLSTSECESLTAAYDFLRRLINGLRLLRGSARDLYLPAPDEEEFVHLARRMGYEKKDGLLPAQQLHLEFDTHTAIVRTFVERHLGRASLPDLTAGNIVDLVLSEDPPEALRERVLRDSGFENVTRAYTNLRRLAGGTEDERAAFSPLSVLAFDVLRHEPNPDMALNNWERFSDAVADRKEYYKELLAQPKRLEILLGVLSRSQFLADSLCRYPEFYEWCTSPENLQRKRRREDLERDLRVLAARAETNSAWLNSLRRFRRREILRIGTRDMCLNVPITEVMHELSLLAGAILTVSLRRIWGELEADNAAPVPPEYRRSFCVLALGKLGGSELNYSSDIDLIGVYDAEMLGPGSDLQSGSDKNPFARVMSRLQADLSDHTEEGHAYRVDLRLRPYGRVGELVHSRAVLQDYYRSKASLWEIQALLKARPIAGNLQVGYDLIEDLYPLIVARRGAEEVRDSIAGLRSEAVRQAESRQLVSGFDVKNGNGGIRDIEFLVQGLQLIHASQVAKLLTGETLQGLRRLERHGFLPPKTARRLAEDYIFLRRIEHYLQILEDRQIHSLPRDSAELKALAHRVEGRTTRAEEFLRDLEACQDRVHTAFRTHLLDSPTPESS